MKNHLTLILTGILSILYVENITAQELIFNSGFEPGSSIINQSSQGADMTGTDTSLSSENSWTDDLEGYPKIGKFSLQYQDVDDNQQAKRKAEIVNDPTNSGRGKVLKYWITDDHVSFSRGRIQANCYGAETGIENYYQRMKLYLPSSTFQPLKDSVAGFSFLTIVEIWNDNNWNPAFETPDAYPYRMKVNITKKEGAGQDFFLMATGEKQSRPCCWGEGEDKIWEEVSTFPLPLNSWFDLELSIKEGNQSTGNFQMAITPASGSKKMLFDVNNWTHNPDDPEPDGIKFFNPLKMYTNAANTLDRVAASGDSLKFYWDDFELWENKLITGVSSPVCEESISWENTSFTLQRNNFEVSWDMIPSANGMDGVVGLSGSSSNAHSQLACVVRFNASGFLDSRNGSVYMADNAIPYMEDTRYGIRMEVNMQNHSYSIYVTPEGGTEIVLGSNYQFGTEQMNIDQLNNLVINTETCSIILENLVVSTITMPVNTFGAFGDAAVRNRFPDVNYALDQSVYILPKSNDISEMLIKFDLSSIEGTVESAILKIHNTTWAESQGTVVKLGLKAVADDSWDESSVTWNTKPDFGSVLLSKQVVDNAYNDFDITDYIAQELSGDQVASLSIFVDMGWFDPFDMRSMISSSESVNPPQLVVTSNQVVEEEEEVVEEEEEEEEEVVEEEVLNIELVSENDMRYLRISPNPVNNSTVSFDLKGFGSSSELEILDVSGKVLFSQLLKGGNGHFEFSSPIVRQHIYFMRVTDEEGYLSRRFVSK